MDRFRWCSDPVDNRNGTETLVLQKSGVRIYNGQGKTTFEKGCLQLTTHRLIWSQAQSSSMLHLPLVAIVSTQLQVPSGFKSSGTPKISAKLLSLSAVATAFKSFPAQPEWAADWIVNKSGKQVAISSGIDFVRFGFTEPGHLEFYRALNEALQAKCWLISDLPTTVVTGRVRGTGGIIGIERQLAEKASSADRSISEAFEDLSRLISRAGEMVTLSRSLAQKIRLKTETGGDVSEDETAELRRAMLSMGLQDSGVDISMEIDGSNSLLASSFHGQLAVQICRLLQPMLSAKIASLSGQTDTDSNAKSHAGGCMDLTAAYCRVNRARGVELISPDDLLQAAKLMKPLKLPLQLKRFDSGVMVFQMTSETDELTIQSTLELVKSQKSMSAGDLSRLVCIAPILARERLLQAEQKGLLCRDDTERGLTFFPNLFLTEPT